MNIYTLIFFSSLDGQFTIKNYKNFTSAKEYLDKCVEGQKKLEGNTFISENAYGTMLDKDYEAPRLPDTLRNQWLLHEYDVIYGVDTVTNFRNNLSTFSRFIVKSELK